MKVESLEEFVRPYQVLIFIVSVMAISGALYWLFPEKSSSEEMTALRTDSAIIEDTELAMIDTIALSDSVSSAIEETRKEVAARPVIPSVPLDSTTDSRVFLQSFYASLSECGEHVVRVLHYGDSQIEEDRMTQQIRDALQKRYGGSGVGLMPLAQTIPSRSVSQQLFMNGKQVQASQGPRRYMVYAPKRDQRKDGLYGVMGQMAVMSDSVVTGSEEIMAVCIPLDGKRRYTRWQVLADSTIRYSFADDTVRLSGSGHVYGLSQESDTGVIVDNLPMRGCLGLVFTKMDSAQLATFYREQHVRLIILQFGGNAIPFNETPSTINAIVRGLRNQVRYLRRLAPEASFLFIGPSDMLTQIDGVTQTYPMVPYMDRMLQKMAMEEEIAYFSLFRFMGGAGSMVRWQEQGLAGADGIHFMRSGARKAGKGVAEWMIEGIKN